MTGASSFTGYWFAKELANRGHLVTAALRGAASSYSDSIRRERANGLEGVVELVDDCAFGSERFIEVIRSQSFDILAHHGAEVGDYKSADFNVAGALASNTNNIRTALREGRFKAVVLTGSVFESDEGVGSLPLVAFSSYGLSKAFTSQVVAHHCREFGVAFGKFVVPNPFGPLEEPRFTAYLMRTWRAGNPARVATPIYVRDNIHISLLAAAYARFIEGVVLTRGNSKLSPSGYVESQGAFAERFAQEMRRRLPLDCAIQFAVQTELPEPFMRVNATPARLYVEGWNESDAWDAVAEFYNK